MEIGNFGGDSMTPQCIGKPARKYVRSAAPLITGNHTFISMPLIF